MSKEMKKKTVKNLPTIADAVEFRRDQMGVNKAEMAEYLGIGRGHYTEMVQGRRRLPFRAATRAFTLGVPATVLLAEENQSKYRQGVSNIVPDPSLTHPNTQGA